MVVSVYQAAIPYAVSSQVIFLHRFSRNGFDESLCIYTKVAHIHIQVFYIEQDTAASTLGQFAYELALSHFAVRKG